MRNCKQAFRTGLGRGMMALALVVLTGCGDTPPREAGKTLRQATRTARKQYDKALALLSNPPENDDAVSDAPSPEVLSLLDQAGKTLSTALTQYVDLLRDTSADAAFRADAGTARMTLGLIRRLQGQYYRWSFDQTERNAWAEMGRISGLLSRLRAATAALRVYQEHLSPDSDSLVSKIAVAQQAQADTRKKTDAIQADLRKTKDDLDRLQASIQDQFAQAGTLRKKATLAKGQQGQDLLENALAIEEKIAQEQSRAQTLENNRLRLASALDAQTIRLDEASAQREALTQIQNQQKTETGSVQEAVDREKTKIRTLRQELARAMQSLDDLCAQANRNVARARNAFAQASWEIADAVSFLGADKQAQALSEQAHARASAGDLELAVRECQKAIAAGIGRFRTIWQASGDDAPALPTTTNVDSFLNPEKAPPTSAAAEYEAAVGFWEQAADRAADDDRWQFQRDLLVGYRELAKLEANAGNLEKAGDYRQKAKALIPSIQDGAKKAGKSRSILPFLKYAESESGA